MFCRQRQRKTETTVPHSLDTRVHAFVLTSAVHDGVAVEPKLWDMAAGDLALCLGYGG